MKKPAWLGNLLKKEAELKGELPDTDERRALMAILDQIRVPFSGILNGLEYSGDRYKEFKPYLDNLSDTEQVLRNRTIKRITDEDKERLVKLGDHLKTLSGRFDFDVRTGHSKEDDYAALMENTNMVRVRLHTSDYAKAAAEAIDKHNSEFEKAMAAKRGTGGRS